MNYTEFALLLLYGACLVLILVLIVRVLQPRPRKEIVIVEERPSAAEWWPWGTTVYNAWPYWAGWWNGGGGYHRSEPVRMHSSSPPSRPWGRHGREANLGAPRGDLRGSPGKSRS